VPKTSNGGFIFPKNGQIIPKCAEDPIAHKPSFRATGFFLGHAYLLVPDKCLVTYTEKASGTPKKVQGSIKFDNGNAWVVEFTDAGLIAANGEFTCTVTNSNDDTPPPVKFAISNAAAKVASASTVSGLLTHINYPTTPDNNTVPSTFACTGTTDSTNAVSGSLVDGSSNVFGGTTTGQGPNWVILFANIPAGVYTLTVVALPDMTSVSPVIVAPNTSGDGQSF
jgi:hypothetical protein